LAELENCEELLQLVKRRN